MVKLEDYWVALATIRARVLRLVLPEFLFQCALLSGSAADITGDVGLVITGVVLTSVRRHASLALAMSSSGSPVPKAERLSLFALATNGAGLHDRSLPVKKDGLLAKPSEFANSGARRSPKGRNGARHERSGGAA
jgi:hypothetical protein